MSDYAGPVDALADELLIAIRDHPGIAEHRLMDPAYGEPNRKLCATYNAVYCELHEREGRQVRHRACVCCTPPKSWPHDDSATFVSALSLHKQRIRQLQEALCECKHLGLFQAALHDEMCPVFMVTREDTSDES